MADAAYHRKWRASHLDSVRASRKKWIVTHRHVIAAVDKRYLAKHAEKVKARLRAYRLANRDKIRAYMVQWREAHKEDRRVKDKIYKRAYNQANPDKRREISARHRALRRNAPINDFTAAQWAIMKAHYKYCCVYCGRKMKRLTQDHITPLSKGGAHTASNIVPACLRCNSSKGVRGPLKPVQPMLL